MARPGLLRHPKFRLYLRILQEPTPHGLGYLELIWGSAYETGNPLIGTSAAVEAVAEYPGELGRLCKALVECGGKGAAGFIEECPDQPGVYQIHDLFDHAPDYVQRRMRRESERQAKGQTLSGIRAEAGRKGGSKRKQMEASDGHLLTDAKQTEANGATPAPAPAPAPAPKERLPTEACTEPRQAAPSVPSEFTFPVVGKGPKKWVLPSDELERYRAAYPALDVEQELREAVRWCETNPGRRKTPGGMLGFITRWMNRAQDRKPQGSGPGPPVGMSEREARSLEATQQWLKR